MKISIITVCLNAKDTIEETFLSIINQTHKEVELIVIDGASTDGTVDVINKYREKITHFVSEPDNGLYDAMNKGINFASGDFVLFLNANDVFYNERILETVVKVLDKNKDVKFLFGDVDYISEDKKTSTIQTYEKVKNIFWFVYGNICHQSIFYHRSLFEQIGRYSNNYKIYSDWDYNIKCLVQNRLSAVYLPIPISKFQLGGLCSSQTSINICKIERKILVEKYYSTFKTLYYANEFLINNIGTLYRFLINNFPIKNVANAFFSQDKYKLNLKTGVDI